MNLINDYAHRNSGIPVFLFKKQNERKEFLKQFDFNKHNVKRLNELVLKYKAGQIHSINDILNVCTWVDIYPGATDRTRKQLRIKFKNPKKLRFLEISIISACTSINYMDLINMIKNFHFNVILR